MTQCSSVSKEQCAVKPSQRRALSGKGARSLLRQPFPSAALTNTARACTRQSTLSQHSVNTTVNTTVNTARMLNEVALVPYVCFKRKKTNFII